MRLDLSKVIDNAKFGRLQAGILALCFLIATIDGYDLVVMGVALPSIISEMKVDSSVGGLIASCALFGMMFGAISMGALADRIGRVSTIALCVFVFSVFTAASGLARDPYTFAGLRFLAGLGLGGVFPCITAVVTEYSPRHSRSRMATLMISGYPLGGVIAALLGKEFLVEFGWPFVFYVAAIPLVLIPFVYMLIPESGAILQKRGDGKGLRDVARRVDPSLSISDADEVFVPLVERQAKAPMVLLFRDGRGFSTVMIWCAYFSGLFMLYALNSWLPKLMAMAGHTIGAALTLLMLMNFGSMIGSFTGGWLADRLGIKRVMCSMLVCGAIAIAVAPQNLPVGLLSVVVFILGVTASGAQGVANAYISQFYPADIRSTGLGMALGVGRIGGIVAPVGIGVLLTQQLSFQFIFYVIAVFGFLQALATWLINDRVADFHDPKVRPDAARVSTARTAPSRG